jgi:hypothetical protein
VDGRNSVDVGHQSDAFLQWPERRRVPAEIAEVRAANREEMPLGVERQLGPDGEIAALPVAEKRVAALAGPFDRPPDKAGGPGKQRIFRVEQIARAEITAHVAADAAHPLRRHVEDLCEVGPHFGDAATAAGVDRVTPARRIVIGGDRARLHRYASNALRPGIEPDDMLGAREGRRGRRHVADLDVDADIIRRLVP